MTVSVDGLVLEAPMTYNTNKDRYLYIVNTATSLVGDRVSFRLLKAVKTTSISNS